MDEQADVIVHLAGLAYVPDSWRDPLSFYQTNVMGTLRVLERCARLQARLVFVSSYVYGTPVRLPINESADRSAANPYMHSKVLAEDCCNFYAAQLGVEVLIVRPFNLYGPGQDSRFVIPTLIDQLLDPAKLAVEVTDSIPRRDFLFVDDLASLMTLAITSEATGTFNAGAGRSHSVQDIYEVLKDITGIDKPLLSKGARRRGEIMDVVADIGRARKLLGWEPTTELRDGLAATITAASRA